MTNKQVILTIVTCMTIMAVGIILISAPAGHLLGESAYAVRSAFHGLVAGIFMVTATIGLYQGFRLWAGTPINIKEWEIGSVVNATACLLTIITGNWIYIAYRATAGPRSYFLETVPELHKIFFEFKEFTGLFTLPFVVAITFIIFAYGEKINKNNFVRQVLAVLLVLTFFYFVVAFGLGAAITKLKSV